ncbi:glycine receptor subunit alpha-2-like [Lineus longissimus]|uniref:glycine receptor subunit alpha-2-like n=1 Tax=Lineus longissimus TaxID=88925 RepID=UPI002B4EE72A
MIVRVCTVSVLVAIILDICEAAKRPSRVLIQELTSGSYDKNERPNVDGDPTRVAFGLFIDHMVIDEKNQEMIYDAYIHDSWNDTRLAWTQDKEDRISLFVGKEDRDRIWHPGIYLPGSTVTLLADNQEKLQVYSSGMVKHESRVTVKSKCYMLYSKFPFDTQTCGITVELFQYTTGDVVLESMIEPSTFIQEALKSNTFTIRETNITDNTFNCSCEAQTTYPSLLIQFKLKRNVGQITKQLFIPSALLMAFLYANFYLGHVLLLPRALYLTVIAMLMCTHSLALKINMTLTLPNTNDLTAYDFWIAIYFAFLVVTLAVYCVVAKLCHRPDGVTTEADAKHMRCGDSLDMTMRVLYPVLYFIFVIAFFANHLVETKYTL